MKNENKLMRVWLSMNIKEVSSMNQKLEQQLIEVWESSVKATHTFLSETEIQAIKQYIPEALHHVPHLIIVESENGEPAGFMGISDRNLEMLFIANEQRGKGLGRKLLAYGMENDVRMISWTRFGRI